MPSQKFNFNLINRNNTDLQEGMVKVEERKDLMVKQKSVTDIAQKLQTKAVSIPFNLKVIPRSKIRLNAKNDYPQDDVEKLANNILHMGLIHNFEAVYDEEEDDYVLESGERRYRAISLLLDRYIDFHDTGSEEYKLFLENVKGFEVGYPVNVKRNKYADTDLTRLDEIDSEMRLINANEELRENGPEMRLVKIQKRDRLLKEKNSLLNQETKVKNINKAIADEEGLSERQVQKYKNISTLIPELQEAFGKSKITLNDGSSMSKLSDDEQKYVLKLIQDGEKISAEEIKILKNNLEEQRVSTSMKEVEIKKLKTDLESTDDKYSKGISDLKKLHGEEKKNLREMITTELTENLPDSKKIKELEDEINKSEQSFQVEKEYIEKKKAKELDEKNREVLALKKELEKLQDRSPESNPNIEYIKLEVKFYSLIGQLTRDMKALKDVYKKYVMMDPENAENQYKTIEKLLRQFSK